jgi:hypothetical protein
MRPAAVEDEPTPWCCGQVKKGRGALSYGFPTRECRLLGRSPKLSLLFLARRLLLQLLHSPSFSFSCLWCALVNYCCREWRSKKSKLTASASIREAFFILECCLTRGKKSGRKIENIFPHRLGDENLNFSSR